MAKIEIQGTPEELERVAIFLRTNSIEYDIVDDFANHSVEDSARYRELIIKHNQSKFK